MPRDLYSRATGEVKSLSIAPEASSVAQKTTWSVLEEASSFPSQLSIPVRKSYLFLCPSLQDVQKSGQTRTETVLELFMSFGYHFAVQCENIAVTPGDKSQGDFSLQLSP